MSTWEFFLEIIPELMKGFSLTLTLTGLSLFIGFGFGILLALGRIYGNWLVRGLCIGYIEAIRGTPMLVQIFIIYFAIPGPFPSRFWAAVLGFSINSAAYQAEYFRGAFQSVESGQMIASRSMGMTRGQSILNIILPQGLRMAIPAWSNEVIYLLKYTSLAYIILVPELTRVGKLISTETARYMEVFIIIAIIYLAATIILTDIIDRFEKRVRIPGLGAEETATSQRSGW
ncbi:MAG: amino acid ABC transporter permease [Candidatus Natronoplasma sp.]